MEQQRQNCRSYARSARLGSLSLLLIVAGWMGATQGWSQTSPPTPPTPAGSATQSGAAASAGTNNGPARYRAEVQANGGQLQVRADNSSLNEILRAISQQTGMTITGGVNDQRVFGTYGPGPAAQVISELLEDTGVNMLLKMTPQGAPAELILSQRTGGPSPPAPSMAREEPADAQAPPVGSGPATSGAAAAPSESSQAPAPAASQSQVPPLPFSQPPAQPAETDPFVTPQTPSPGGIVSAPTVAPATEPGTTPGPETQTTGTSGSSASGESSTNPASPNGVKTPQQIYQELQKLLEQQQKQQNQPSGSQKQSQPSGSQ